MGGSTELTEYECGSVGCDCCNMGNFLINRNWYYYRTEVFKTQSNTAKCETT